MLKEILLVLGIGATVASYIYLISHFIKYELYKNSTIFDIIIMLLGPIGLALIILLGMRGYDDEQ